MIDIKEIWETQKPTSDIIIKTKIESISHLNCYVATNSITRQHLYIMSVAKNVSIPELKSYRFKGVEIFSFETENSFELNIYLLDDALKDIFILFIQNIIGDIETNLTEIEALTITLNVISKWKKLFDKINFSGLTLEYQKGLIGELLFINQLLNREFSINKLFEAWTGPDKDDKDFRFGSLGVEIKLTSSKHPKLKITNEGQLDTQNIEALFLILYVVENVKENGFTLNSLIDQIRNKLRLNSNVLSLFNRHLFLMGYFEDEREHYNTMYSIKEILGYSVENNFPKVIKSQLPLGIYDTSYSIQLSAIESFKTEIEELLELILN